MWESSQLLKVPWIPSSSWVHVGWKTARVRLNSNVFPDRPIDNEARTLAKQTRVIGCPRSWPNYQLHLVLLWLFGCGSFCFRWGNTCTCHPWICTCNASLQGVGRGFGWLAISANALWANVKQLWATKDAGEGMVYSSNSMGQHRDPECQKWEYSEIQSF